jgi:uncharacterized damage-inducible protein DinB
MIDAAYVQTLAQYNLWQNESLYAAAATLSDAQRRENRGAFSKSIHTTLNNLLSDDQTWMSRLAGFATPAAVLPGIELFADWDELTDARRDMDARIVAWAQGLTCGPDAAALDGELVWFCGVQKSEVKMPRWLAIAHFANHQTYHRGQVHALLTGLGAQPQVADIVMMPQFA